MRTTRRCRIIEEYEPPAEPSRAGRRRCAGIGFGASEAPRGMLYHRYRWTMTG